MLCIFVDYRLRLFVVENVIVDSGRVYSGAYLGIRTKDLLSLK